MPTTRSFETLRSKFSGRMLTFGIRNKADVSASRIRQDADHADFTMTAEGAAADVRLRAVGTHNIYNALAAAAAALAVGMPLDAVKFGLDDFSPVAMRSEIKEIQGRTVLADYYNANPASMDAAIATLVSLAPGRKSFAVLGDMLELGQARCRGAPGSRRGAARARRGHRDHRRDARETHRRGRDRSGHAEGTGASMRRPHAEAAELLKKLSRPGDVVLIKGSRGMKMEKILEGF